MLMSLGHLGKITITITYDSIAFTLILVELPDGRVQIVSYHADHENGFIADVRYEGEVHCI